MAGHHFTMLVIMVTSTLPSTRLIREEHCNPSCEIKYGTTPLHLACSNGHLNIAQYLIREEHCNPSCENNNGDTPLHRACFYNHASILLVLYSPGSYLLQQRALLVFLH